MTVALLSIGTELARGEITNTNAAWLASELCAEGLEVGSIEVVPDSASKIVSSLRRLAQDHAFVIATGGLGPTTDDLSASAAAEAAGLSLVLDESSLLAIRRRVEARGKVFNAGHEKQAWLPRSAEVLPNQRGTAPGFALRLGSCTAFFLPGVPKEMKPMFGEQVLPRLRPSAVHDSFQLRLRTYGMPESELGLALAGIEPKTGEVTIGYRVDYPEVEVKVLARAATLTEARDRAQNAAREVRAKLGDVVYGEDLEAFPEVVGRALRARGWRLAVAESCTGGLVAHLITSYPASDYFVGSAVTYANAAKTRLLGVPEDTLRWHGAVSPEATLEMAKGARDLCECEVALAVTGFAGPTGGTATRPVGQCYWAVAHPGGVLVREAIFSGDREEIQRSAAFAGLDLLRRVALGLIDR